MTSQEARAASNREEGQSLHDIRAVIEERSGPSLTCSQVGPTDESSERQWTTSEKLVFHMMWVEIGHFI